MRWMMTSHWYWGSFIWLWLLASIYALGLAALLFYGLYCALAARRLRGVQYKKAKGRPLDSTSLPESLGSS
jgi:hypothetical protein